LSAKLTIDGREISDSSAPYVVAEISANHNGNIESALRLIDVAKESGADAVKLQTYTADTMTIDSDLPDFQITQGLWRGRSLYQLYDWAHTPWEWHAELFARAQEVGISIFSSPFDTAAVDFLEQFNPPAYKIASFEVIDLPLIRYAASTGRPLILSTGMANLNEIEEAVTAARDGGCREMAVLHCVSSYPAPPSQYNLATISRLKDILGLVIGLSDHTLSNLTAVASIACGAKIVEKHFTLNRDDEGPDNSFSLEPAELALLVQELRDAWQSIGSATFERQPSEVENLKYRRSLYFVANVAKGAVVTQEHVRSIRPGYGIPPKNIDLIIGKTLRQDVVKGTPVHWDLFTT
jgi:pseudaminic acid synthase